MTKAIVFNVSPQGDYPQTPRLHAHAFEAACFVDHRTPFRDEFGERSIFMSMLAIENASDRDPARPQSLPEAFPIKASDHS
jgi:hypothetical protein